MAGYSGPFKGVFKQGDEGQDCAAVKRCLKRIGNNTAIKGGRSFGKASSDALKRFQTKHKLEPDGVYGLKTHRAMAPLMRGYEVFLYKRAPVRESALSTWVVMAPNADRKGVSTHQEVKDFVSKIAHQYGHPLIIGTGTNHNQYVLGTKRESEHWTGHAADIPMYGANLTKLGRAALVAAGMPKLQAMVCRGGIYNIGNKQVIFNTMSGGNHYNHCHVSVR